MSFWPDDEDNCGSELTMSSQLRKTRSMDSSCLELRLGPPPPPGHPPNSLHHGGVHHLAPALSRAKSEANIHASSLSLGPGAHCTISPDAALRNFTSKRMIANQLPFVIPRCSIVGYCCRHIAGGVTKRVRQITGVGVDETKLLSWNLLLARCWERDISSNKMHL